LWGSVETFVAIGGCREMRLHEDSVHERSWLAYDAWASTSYGNTALREHAVWSVCGDAIDAGCAVAESRVQIASVGGGGSVYNPFIIELGV